MYAVTSIWLGAVTRANLYEAASSASGVVVYTRRGHPRRGGLPLKRRRLGLNSRLPPWAALTATTANRGHPVRESPLSPTETAVSSVERVCFRYVAYFSPCSRPSCSPGRSALRVPTPGRGRVAGLAVRGRCIHAGLVPLPPSVTTNQRRYDPGRAHDLPEASQRSQRVTHRGPQVKRVTRHPLRRFHLHTSHGLPAGPAFTSCNFSPPGPRTT